MNNARNQLTVRTLNAAQLFAIAAIVAAGTCHAGAAEFKLRADCKVTAAVVRLSDLAEVTGADSQQCQQLGKIELFPSPPANTKRFVRAREVQDLLTSRGVNMASHKFSGAVLTVVNAKPETFDVRTASASQPVISESLQKKVNRRVSDAIVRSLRSTTGHEEPWQVAVSVPEEQVKLVSDAREIKITGGQKPWIGQQSFRLTMDSRSGPLAMPIEANITLPEAILVTTHPMARGAIIRADDVELRSVLNQQAGAEPMFSAADAVGKELVKSLIGGQALDTGSIRAPNLVKKGDVVTVYARSAGLTVKTQGKSRDDGSSGDLVSIESLTDKSVFYARVSGRQEAEVFAHATTAR